MIMYIKFCSSEASSLTKSLSLNAMLRVEFRVKHIVKIVQKLDTKIPSCLDEIAAIPLQKLWPSTGTNTNLSAATILQ